MLKVMFIREDYTEQSFINMCLPQSRFTGTIQNPTKKINGEPANFLTRLQKVMPCHLPCQTDFSEMKPK